MRLFVAVHLGRRFREELNARLDTWRPRLDVRWVDPELWHLTLQFLGQWPAGGVQALHDALERESRLHPPLRIRPGVVGAFPHLRSPRVLFLQMDESAQLADLAAGVRRRTARLAGREMAGRVSPDEKSFRPHLTLARIKQTLPKSQRDVPPTVNLGKWDPLDIANFRLIRSQLDHSGPRYESLASFPLRGGR